MSASRPLGSALNELEVEKIRQDFPVLAQNIHGHPLAYLDNAASSQRPRQVIDAIANYYEQDHANVHRGVHTLSHRATDAYEGARETVRRFVNASSVKEIVFTRGTTEAINLVAYSLGQSFEPGDEIILSQMEHHANIVPWQIIAERTGANLVVVPMDQRGVLDLNAYEALLGDRTRLVAIAHVSNALGTINPVGAIVEAARSRDVPVLLDGAQAVPHMSVDVQALDCDFYAFSGHKMCGPTGIGVLYARESLLKNMPVFMGGGDMIRTVSFEKTEYNELPYRFEAGTPHIAGAIGLAAAVEYLQGIGMERIAARETHLLNYGTQVLSAVDDLQMYGTAPDKAGVLSFLVSNIHPHDLGTVLDHQGVAIRTGHHCAEPVMQFFGIAGTARASVAFYNTEHELDQLAEGIGLAVEMFS